MKPQRKSASKAPGKSKEELRRLTELEKKAFQGLSIEFPPPGDESPIKVTLDYSFDQAPDVTKTTGRFITIDLPAINAMLKDMFSVIDARVPHFRGRPKFPNTLEIVDEAAKIRAEGGMYTWIARKRGLTTKQLQERIRTHRTRFDQKVAEYKTSKKTS